MAGVKQEIEHMNSKPLRPCNKPECPNLTRNGYCEQHKTAKADNNRNNDKYSRNKKHDRFYHAGPWTKCGDNIKIRDGTGHRVFGFKSRTRTRRNIKCQCMNYASI